MATEFVSQAWNAYKKNFWQLIGAMALYIAIIFVLALVLLVPLFMAFIPSTSIESQITIESMSGSQTKSGLYPALNPYMIAAAGAVIIVMMLAMIALRAGFVRVCADALRGKANLGTMFSVARKKFRTIIAANLLVLLLLLPLYLLALLMALLVSGAAPLAFFTYFIILLIPIALIAILFSLVDQSVVVGDCRAVEAVKKSLSIIKANYLQFLGLIIIIAAISMLVSFVPIIGSLISIFLVAPIADLSYTAFYLHKTAGKKAVKIRKTRRKRKR